MSFSPEMSKGATQQLTYAVGNRRAALVHGGRVDADSVQRDLERMVSGPVAFVDQRAGADAKVITETAAKADAVHIACDYTVTPTVLAAVREALARKPKAPFIVLSTRALQLSDIDRSATKIFPIVIAWGEVS